MTKEYERQYRALRDIRDMCAKRPEAFRDDGVAATMLAQLNASVDEATAGFTDHASWVSAHRQSTARRGAGRTLLRSGLKAIAQTGPVVAMETGSHITFELPKDRKDQQLISIAEDFAARATPLVDRFAAHKLPAAVITDLPAQIAELDGAMTAQREARRSHKAVREAVATALRKGWEAVDTLERMYMNVFRNDAKAVTDWKEARRIGPSQPTGAGAPSAPSSAAPETTTAPIHAG